MRMHVPLGENVTSDSPAGALDARVKLGLLFLSTIALFSASRPWLLVPWLVLLAGALWAARMGVGSIARAMRPVAIILGFTLVANALVLDGTAPIRLVGVVGINPAGALRGAMAVLRIGMLVGFALAVSSSTTPPDLADACVRLLSPLRRLGVPVADVGLSLSLALRFIPIVSEEFERIRLAQRSRGVRFDEGGAIQRVRVWSSVLTPLVVGLFRRADRLGESMAARCYGAAEATRRPRPLGSRDRAILVCGLIAIALLGIMGFMG